MGIRLTLNVAQLEANIENLAKQASKNASRSLRRSAIRIRDLAREYAPFDTGTLEESIKDGVAVKNGRNTYVVYIDLDMIRPKVGRDREKFVGDYAWIMEEELHPYGRQKAGRRYFKATKKSLSRGKKVGGRFLARAVRDGKLDVFENALTEVRRTLSSSRYMSDVTYTRDVDSFGDD